MNNSALEERLIVACPACETKFAVLRSALSQVETPRFHCSRCDNVFVVSVDELSPLDSTVPAAASEESNEEQPPKTSPTSPMFPQPNFDEGVESDMGHAAQKANPTTELNDTQEIRDALDKIPDNPAPPQDDFVAVPTMKPDRLEEQEEVVSRGPGPIPDFGEQSSLFDQDDEPEGYRGADSVPEFAPPERDNSHIAPVTTQSSWRTCIFIAAPIALCLVGLFAVSIVVKQFPELVDPYIPRSIAALPEIAPSGLYINDLRLKNMDLDSGEKISVIAGTLHNDTAEEFESIVLEGLGFDEEGNPVSNVRIAAGAGLGNAKIKSLSREMINDLQNRPPIKKFSLPPQESYSFTIALTGAKPQKLAHYSARVYSVVR